MNDFVLFPDGTWTYESELPDTKSQYNGLIKIKNPFNIKLDVVKPEPETKPNRFYVMSFDPTRGGIYPGRWIQDISGTLIFTADQAVHVGDTIPLIKQDNVSFYDVLVTEVKFEQRAAIYTGLPDTWYEFEK